MKRHAKQIVLWTAFLLLPMSVDAQITDYTGSLGATEYLNFLGSGGAVVSDRAMVGSSRVYVGPYAGSFGEGPTSPQFSLICVDFQHYAGSQQVNVSGLGTDQTGAGLGATRLGAGGDSFVRYRKAAYLATLFDDASVTGSEKTAYWSAVHAAIWKVITDVDVGGAVYADRDYLVGLANDEASSFSTDGWYVLSGVNSPGGQEMLIRTPASTVPEPSTYLLMATGLLFLVFFGRKRMGELDEG